MAFIGSYQLSNDKLLEHIKFPIWDMSYEQDKDIRKNL